MIKSHLVLHSDQEFLQETIGGAVHCEDSVKKNGCAVLMRREISMNIKSRMPNGIYSLSLLLANSWRSIMSRNFESTIYIYKAPKHIYRSTLQYSKYVY